MHADAAPAREFEFTEADFRRVRELIHARAGIALVPAKRDMAYSRLSRRLRALGLRSFRDYLAQLDDDDSPEWEAFTNALTTNLTSFFREPHHFEVLAGQLRRLGRARTIHVWSCAASTGEEPYSIAMVACEVFGTLAPPVRIVATDVDTQVLATAARGVYPIERVEGLDIARKRAFLQRGSGANAGLCRVRAELRQLVSFQQHNLLSPQYPDFGSGSAGFSAVFCRNVMIYFDKPTQRAILSRLLTRLAPDGLLYTGHSENYLHAADLIESCGRTLYRAARRGAAA